MAAQRTPHQVGMGPLREGTETPPSPVTTTVPRHDIDGRSVNATGAPFYLQHQARANMSSGASGLPSHLSYPSSNFAGTQTQYHAPFNTQRQSQQPTTGQSFNTMTQSPAPHRQSNFYHMSPTTTAVRNNANHAFAGTHAEARPDITNLPPVSPMHGIGKSQEPTMPQDRPTYKATPVGTDGKRFLCQCGRRTKTLGDMERHHESLKHSNRKYFCACGKKYARKDSRARHEKKCAMQTQVIA